MSAGVIAAAAIAVAGSAAAQSSSDRQLADYAAILGQRPLVTTDAVTGEKRRLSASEVEAAAARSGVRRTAAEKRKSVAANRMLASMPATYEESLAEASTSRQGVNRRTSLEEIQVSYGVVGPDGKLNAAHDPDDASQGSVR